MKDFLQLLADQVEEARQLGIIARAYVKEVKARREAGDTQAEYHSQNYKHEAYRLIIANGTPAKDAPRVFSAFIQEAAKQVEGTTSWTYIGGITGGSES